MVDAMSMGLPEMLMGAICVEAAVGRLLAKSKPIKVVPPNHLRTDEELSKKLSYLLIRRLNILIPPFSIY
jgi:hypothetical protein